ncbi:hypothetical protein, partial [Thalassotalea sp. G2M2-11]|uniref:hypothetical protein n=1 Tax=Thalassotalea sp. G2M2-11 TaxID=2787627 RepID=UPI0019D0208C
SRPKSRFNCLLYADYTVIGPKALTLKANTITKQICPIIGTTMGINIVCQTVNFRNFRITAKKIIIVSSNAAKSSRATNSHKVELTN